MFNQAVSLSLFYKSCIPIPYFTKVVRMLILELTVHLELLNLNDKQFNIIIDWY